MCNKHPTNNDKKKEQFEQIKYTLVDKRCHLFTSDLQKQNKLKPIANTLIFNNFTAKIPPKFPFFDIRWRA